MGMSLLFEDMCKMLSDTSIVENGIRMLEEEDASTEVGITIWKLSILEVSCEYKSVVISGMTM